MINPAMECPCCSGAAFSRCCGPVLDGRPAPTAEALMRSRYTAFAVGDGEHLRRSWAPESRPVMVGLDDAIVWRGLTIVDTVAGDRLDAHGVVEFEAAYDAPTGPGVVHERSTFRREAGAWVYVAADDGS